MEVPTLLLLRHGESAWNASNRFTGWVDVDLTARGEEQARHSGVLLRQADLLPGSVHTSVLTRAQRTARLLLDAAGEPEVPVAASWRLNERCYGALQGLDRGQVWAQFGDRQFQRWRRSYDAAPPPLPADSPWDVSRDPRYAELAPDLLPRSESLADVVGRLLPYWYDAVVADLHAGRPVLVVAHGNSLRALIAHLDRLSPQEVLELNIPTGMPLRYELGPDLTPLVRGGDYLEPAQAATAAAAVAAQGRDAPVRREAGDAAGQMSDL
jgi:2,3-bisphosphoglycerate-dependent phosphoglycerate mutase